MTARVLLTLADVAVPANGGKRLRAASVVTALAAHAELDVVVLHSSAPPGPALPPGTAVHQQVRFAPSPRPASRTALRLAARRVPWQVAAQSWQDERALLRQWSQQPYDLVWFGALDHLLALHDAVQAHSVVVDVDDVETVKSRGMLALPVRPGLRARRQRLQRRVELPLWQAAERRAEQLADAVVVCSALDQRRLGSSKAVVLPNTYPDPDPAGAPRPRPRDTLVLVANYEYEPNVDGARWVLDEVWPRVRAARPDAVLRLVGRAADRALASRVRPGTGVEVHSDVPDVGVHLRVSTAALAATRWGGGTRLKILEAFAYRVPVVSTTLAAEGLDLTPGEHLLVEDDAAGYARACVRLLEDDALADRLARAGRARYDDAFRPDRATEAVAQVVAPLLARTGGRRAGTP